MRNRMEMLRVGLVLAAVSSMVANGSCQMDTSSLERFSCTDQASDYCQTTFPGTRCVDGYCRGGHGGDVCEPGSVSCSGGLLTRCNSDGTEETRTVCELGCSTTGTSCNECPPGTANCLEGSQVTCSARGELQPAIDCSPFGCNAAGTACNNCMPDTVSCSDGVVVTCDGNGAISSSTDCDPLGCNAAGTACNECQPDAVTCAEDTLTTCGADGTIESTAACVPFGCNPSGSACNQCEPESSTCSNGTQVDCSAGGLVQPEIDCSPYGCNTAGTTCNQCSPATAVCEGGTLTVCGSDGTVESTTPCTTYGCNTAGTACNQCTPGQTECRLDELVVCDVDGQIASQTECGFGCNADRSECNQCTPSTTGCHEDLSVMCTANGTIETSRDCDELDEPCIDGFCQVTDGYCHTEELSEYTPCDSGDPCMNGQCDDNGECMPTTPVGAGVACDDGIACVVGSTCDNEGHCGGGTPTDSACSGYAEGELCRPLCSADSSGCVLPPTRMTLDCVPVIADVDLTSTCQMTLDGLEGQADHCLSCGSEVGVTVVARTDFEDDANPGQCAPQVGTLVDGWTMLGNGQCYTIITPTMSGCTLGTAADCCTSFACALDVGETTGASFSADKALCSGREEWAIERSFDTSGLSDIELCFGYADHGASSDEVLYVEVSDGTNIAGDCDSTGPRSQVNDQFYRWCYSLPSWAEDISNLRVRFFLHSDDNDDILYLDDISLRGWNAQCVAAGGHYSTILEETFSDDCPTMVEWTSTGSISCTDTNDAGFSTWRVHVGRGQAGSIERDLDLSDLDGDVTLCFDYGDDNATSNESLKVEFDTSTGWQPAWVQLGDPGADDTEVSICVNLSDLDPAVNRNPAVGLRFTLTSASTTGTLTIDVDNISVQGAVYCDGSGLVDLTEPVDDGGGAYHFAVSNSPQEQLTADVMCGWDTPPAGAVEAMDSLWFVP